MDIESIFFTIFTVWYFSRYIPEDTLNTLYGLHVQATKIVDVYNRVFFPLYFSLDQEEELKDDLKEEIVENTTKKRMEVT
jgi:hypothetical protein